MEQQFRPKPLLIVAALFAVLLIIGLMDLARSQGDKNRITLTAAPSIARLTLDGNPIKEGAYPLRPGSHTLAADLENFAPAEEQFTVKARQAAKIAIALTPANDAGWQLLKDHPNYQYEREAVGGEEQAGQAALSATPLIAKLPYIDMSGPFAIDYGVSARRPGGTVIIISDSSPHGRGKALDWIRQQGSDPTDLEIQFANFTNPFASTPPALSGERPLGL